MTHDSKGSVDSLDQKGAWRFRRNQKGWKATQIMDTGKAIDYGAGIGDALMHPPLDTGLKSLNTACVESGGEGIPHWYYCIIGGASNAGKTQTLWYLLSQACKQELHPAIITMEVPTTGIQRSFYARVTDFAYGDFLPKNWVKDEVANVDRLRTQIADFNNDDRRTFSVSEFDGLPDLDDIMDEAYRLKDAGHSVIGVDHLQHIRASRNEDIAELATEVSEALRMFAHKEKVLVLAASQLNRTASRERDRQPISQDLWGGTAMESNANMVLLMDHSVHIRDPADFAILRTNLVLDKQREGPNRVRIPIEFNFRKGSCREGMPDEEYLWNPKLK